MIESHNRHEKQIKFCEWIVRYSWVLGAIVVIAPIAYTLNNFIAASAGYFTSKLLIDMIDSVIST